jgi:hypothetical protein
MNAKLVVEMYLCTLFLACSVIDDVFYLEGWFRSETLSAFVCCRIHFGKCH